MSQRQGDRVCPGLQLDRLTFLASVGLGPGVFVRPKWSISGGGMTERDGYRIRLRRRSNSFRGRIMTINTRRPSSR
jgi:hypothetical protein